MIAVAWQYRGLNAEELEPTDAIILDLADSLISGAAVRVCPSEPPKPGR